jgi:hypothetical protein
MEDETCIQNFSQMKGRNQLQEQGKDVKQHMNHMAGLNYSGADKFLSRPRKKQATATEDFEFYISYL